MNRMLGRAAPRGSMPPATVAAAVVPTVVPMNSRRLIRLAMAHESVSNSRRTSGRPGGGSGSGLRDPDRAGAFGIEGRRGDADDHSRTAVDHDLRSDHGRRRLEAIHPVAMAQHGDGGALR